MKKIFLFFKRLLWKWEAILFIPLFFFLFSLNAHAAQILNGQYSTSTDYTFYFYKNSAFALGGYPISQVQLVGTSPASSAGMYIDVDCNPATTGWGGNGLTNCQNSTSTFQNYMNLLFHSSSSLTFGTTTLYSTIYDIEQGITGSTTVLTSQSSTAYLSIGTLDSSLRGSRDADGTNIISNNNSSSSIYAVLNPNGTSTTQISFVQPFANSAGTDFGDWQLNLSNLPAGTIRINYDRGTGNLATDTGTYSPFINTNPFSILKSQPLIFPPLVEPVSYNATATALNASGTIIATDHIQFLVTYPTGETQGNGTSTQCNATTSPMFSLSGSPPYFSIADPTPYVQNAFCSAAQILFIPNSGQQNDLKQKYSDLGRASQNYPPFSFFFSSAKTIENLTSTVTTTLDIYKQGSIGNFFSDIRNYFGYALWIILAIAIIKTMIKIQT